MNNTSHMSAILSVPAGHGSVAFRTPHDSSHDLGATEKGTGDLP